MKSFKQYISEQLFDILDTIGDYFHPPGSIEPGPHGEGDIVIIDGPTNPTPDMYPDGYYWNGETDMWGNPIYFPEFELDWDAPAYEDTLPTPWFLRPDPPEPYVPPNENPDDDIWAQYPWAEGTIFLQNGDLAIPCEDCPTVRGCPPGYQCFPCSQFGTCQEGEHFEDAFCPDPPCAWGPDDDGNWWFSSDGENWFPWNDFVHGDHP